MELSGTVLSLCRNVKIWLVGSREVMRMGFVAMLVVVVVEVVVVVVVVVVVEVDEARTVVARMVDCFTVGGVADVFGFVV